MMTDEQNKRVMMIHGALKRPYYESVGTWIELCAQAMEIIDELQKEVEQLTKERDDARADANYMKVVAGVK